MQGIIEMLRPIIEIDEEKCDGCGQCVLDCAEGALAIVNGKAKLISEVYCDGLGACLNCPKDALKLSMREAPAFDEEAALQANAAREGACPGAAARSLKPLNAATPRPKEGDLAANLSTWPLQLALVPPTATYLKDARLLLGAHCAGFALPDIQKDWMTGRVPIIACPKLEDRAALTAKLAAILKTARPQSITILRMSVPCCGGLERIVEKAIEQAGVNIPVDTHIVRLG